ncbi:hypothetical protein HGRIS_011741 [Hohenbuehelia grisea]|uniref:Uncharacterized protein n=1 Tax=Hohenbuehelia grisea TaxID=104357 RepID=A0ABR3JX11_9AGAR
MRGFFTAQLLIRRPEPSQNHMKFSLSIIAALFATTTVYASPIDARAALDVFVPPVTAPVAGAVWPIGSQQNVTWDISNAPTQITNRFGRIVLRKGDLTTSIILAAGFDILNAVQEVTVPDVTPDVDYSLTLFGDSGNFSPTFSIVA